MTFLPHEKCGLTFLKRYQILFVSLLRLPPSARPPGTSGGSLRAGLGPGPRRQRSERSPGQQQTGEKSLMDREIRIRIPEEHYRTLREMATLRRVSLSNLAGEILGEKLLGKKNFEERVLLVLTELQNINHPKESPKEGPGDENRGETK